MYAVFTSYYKYGEVDMEIINSDDEMRKYCIKWITGYHNLRLRWVEYYRSKNILPPEKFDVICDVSDLDTLSIYDLIKLTIECGNKMVEQQGGWGVRYIIKGDNLKKL